MALLLSRVKQAGLRLNHIPHRLKRCCVHRDFDYHNPINQAAIHRRPTEFLRLGFRFFAAPVQVKKNEEVKNASVVRLNEQIKADFVRLVTDEGHSVVARHEALHRAKNLKLDLVEVDRHAKPPVCKLFDYNKERYKQQVKEKERTKRKSEGSVKKGDCKEVRFSAKTELKDLKMKADMTKRLMERGYRVKCMAMGTEDQDLGGLLSQLSAMDLETTSLPVEIEDVAFVESGPRLEKKQAYVIVRHVKFGPSKKGGKKASKVDGTISSEIHDAANAWSNDPVELEEEASSEEYAMDSDDAADTPLQGQEETVWSVSDTNRGFDKVCDLGHAHDMSWTSRQMKFDTKAASSSAANSKAADISPSRMHNFIDQNVRPSSQEPENRYARNVTKNVSAIRNTKLPNYGSQPRSPGNFVQGKGSRQAGNEGYAGNIQRPQNENPQDRGEVRYQVGQFEQHKAPVGLREPHSSASSCSSQSSGFGIFSTRGVGAFGKYGSGVAAEQSGSPSSATRRNSYPKLNSQSVKSDSGEKLESDDGSKCGVISRENPNSVPGRMIQGEGKVH